MSSPLSTSSYVSEASLPSSSEEWQSVLSEGSISQEEMMEHQDINDAATDDTARSTGTPQTPERPRARSPQSRSNYVYLEYHNCNNLTMEQVEARLRSTGASSWIIGEKIRNNAKIMLVLAYKKNRWQTRGSTTFDVRNYHPHREDLGKQKNNAMEAKFVDIITTCERRMGHLDIQLCNGSISESTVYCTKQGCRVRNHKEGATKRSLVPLHKYQAWLGSPFQGTTK
ncbi:13491_t:CDS:2, partial [Acaulospora colombiana]